MYHESLVLASNTTLAQPTDWGVLIKPRQVRCLGGHLLEYILNVIVVTHCLKCRSLTAPSGRGGERCTDPNPSREGGGPSCKVCPGKWGQGRPRVVV